MIRIYSVAMILHKSQEFITILDISFCLKHNRQIVDSFNLVTTKQAPEESMIQLGPCVKRPIATLADHYNPNQTFRFAKLDIKDGFWCLQVRNNMHGTLDTCSHPLLQKNKLTILT